jgi:hypothetical protein
MKTMKNYLLLLFLLFQLCGFSQNGKSAISGIEARLFYNQSPNARGTDVAGTFSDNIIDNANATAALWNVIIGEGFACGYTSQTAVIVVVKSTDMSNMAQSLRLLVTNSGKMVSDQTVNFSCIGSPAESKILFVLNDTGCQELTLKAEVIVSGKTVSALKKVIPFACGE